MGISLIQLVGEYLLNQRVRDDKRIVESIVSQISPAYSRMDIEDIQAIATNAGDSGNNRVLILDTDGVVQYDTESTLTGTEFMTDEVSGVLAGSASEYGFYDSGSHSGFLAHAAFSLYQNIRSMHALYASDIKTNGAVTGVLVYITPIQEIYASLHSIQIRILFWLIIVALLVLVVSSLIMRSFTGPLNELNDGIRKMTAGDLSARIEVHGHNEFTDVAVAFNTMSQKLEALDESRSRFVSNASHELKTPLSTMKILSETLVYQDPPDIEMTKEFLGDINREIDRLNNVVSDLLTLSKIDSGSTHLDLTTFSLNALLNEQVKRLLPLARENGIEINFEPKDDVHITGDTVKLQQVFYNVIDNAIKYTPRGGEVEVSLARSGKNVVIRVADTGIGIPAADLEHIFDRFYRVDKARSRATGGTGLGLSIVKQTIMQHGGNITAQSTEGKGTTFEIVLPVSKQQ